MPPQVPPGTPIQVIGVSVVAETPGPDLAIDLLVGAFPVTFMATLTLSADGEKLEISTDLGFETTIPFGILAGLAGQPILTKVAGTVGSDAAIVLLANLDIQAGDQSDDPLPPGEHLDRGDASFVASICRLATVIYRVDGVDLPLTFDDAMTRADTGALAGRDLSVVTLPADASTTIPDGTLARSVSPSRRVLGRRRRLSSARERVGRCSASRLDFQCRDDPGTEESNRNAAWLFLRCSHARCSPRRKASVAFVRHPPEVEGAFGFLQQLSVIPAS